MDQIKYINRTTGQIEIEKVYGGSALKFLYGTSFLSRTLGLCLRHVISYFPFSSRFYGYLQKRPQSAKKVAPFIKEFQVDESEFLESSSSFKSFNDFFIRHLKPAARPIVKDENVAIIPADGRYYFFEKVSDLDHFFIKGKHFNLDKLLNNPYLSKAYRDGSMAIARLCPSDYHRFHFPVDCTPNDTILINGPLYSVNPVAIKQNIEIFWENKRTLCELDSQNFGNVLFLEIGATSVGSIHETYTPNVFVHKGTEKGYFSFGGSCLILLFPPESIQFDQDLLEATKRGLEMRCLLGQSMGRAKVNS